MTSFNFIIDPFIYLIKQLFLFSYSITHNYGASIVLLSFLLSLLLLPIFMLIEKVKRKDDKVKLRMKPLIDEINRCYKGQERYYYIRTINRQHSYNPVRALIPTLTLLIQIPFFIAAYQFLEHYKPLAGVSFLFIKDLAAPDAVFGSINILPILMTMVNLLTAYFYTRNGNTAERKQMLIIAGVFLVLLFKLPAGLVLYWTMNNVFSFFRLFITNPEVFKKQEKVKRQSNFSFATLRQSFVRLVPKLKTTFVVLLFIVLLVQLNWAFSHNFSLITTRLLGAVATAFVITLVLAGLTLIHRVEKPIGNTHTIKTYFKYYFPVFKPMLIVLCSAAAISQISWAIQFDFNDIWLRIIGALAACGLITILLALMVLFYKGHVGISLKRFNYKLHRNKPAYIASFIVLFALTAYSQINWAVLQSGFNEIVPRITVMFFVSYFLTLIFDRVVYKIKNDSKLTSQQFKLFLINERQSLILWWGTLFIIVAILQINWALQHTFDNIIQRLMIVFIASIVVAIAGAITTWLFKTYSWSLNRIIKNPQLFFSLFFLSIYFHFSSLHYFSGYNIQLSSLAISITGITFIIAFINFRKRKTELNKALRTGIYVLLTLLMSILLINPWFSSIYSQLKIDIFTTQTPEANHSLVQLINYGLLSSLILSFFYYNKTTENKKPAVKNWGIYLLAVLYLCGFIFLWNPLSVYSTYPDNFEFPAIEILQQNIGLFGIVLLSAIGLYFILHTTLKQYWLFAILIITCMGFMHNTLFPIDMGSLQERRFLHDNNLAQPVIIYILEALAFIALSFFVSWIFKKKYFRQIRISLLVLNLVLISQSLIASVGSGSFMQKPEIISNTSHNITFSKTKENIVYLITDMFHGWFMDSILKESPELNETFDGFTWYPNALSVSSTTAGTLPALLGGYGKTIDKLNKEKGRIFQEKMTDISTEFFNKIKSKNYLFTGNKFLYSTFDKSLFDYYLPPWDKSWDMWNSKLNIGISKEVGFSLLRENALFYTSPVLFKPNIYNNGDWLKGPVETNENTNEAKTYNFLRLLPFISNTNSTEPNFVYIHTWASHHPWDIIDKNGILHNLEVPYENNKWVIETLAKWIDWMKANGVYDNTKIVILSDHGPHWKEFSTEIAGNMPFTHKQEMSINEKIYSQMVPLLLTKDINQTGKLNVDSSFISNVDAYYFIFNEENPIKTTSTNQRELPFQYVIWQRELHLKEEVLIEAKGTVKNNVYDLSNWKVE